VVRLGKRRAEPQTRRRGIAVVSGVTEGTGLALRIYVPRHGLKLASLLWLLVAGCSSPAPSVPPSGTTSPAPPSAAKGIDWSELFGSIAFVSSPLETEVHDVFRLDLNGRAPEPPQRLTSGTSDLEYIDPSWSPDGQWIAVRQFDWQRSVPMVAVIPAAGGEPQIVVQGATPAWSPDGAAIAYAYSDGVTVGIWVIERVGSGWDAPRRLTQTPHYATPEEYPRFSPDGTNIAFASHRAGNWDIWVMRADGTDLRNLTKHPALEYGFDWSPDGKQIVFDRDDRGQTDLYLINLDGTNERPLAAEPFIEAGPCWSPDGGFIAHTAKPDGEPIDLWVMRADGTGRRRLTSTPDPDAWCDWH
jgi:Tol biopolymer transport system component